MINYDNLDKEHSFKNTNKELKGILDIKNRIDLEPPYQRGFVWSNEFKVKLICSIVENRPINVVSFVRKDNEAKYNEFYCLDGKQRLSSIFEFVEDGFKIPILLDGKRKLYKYSHLVNLANDDNKAAKKILAKFEEYTIPHVIYEPMSFEEAKKLFENINYSKQLTQTERIYSSNYIAKRFYRYLWDEYFSPLHKFFDKKIIKNYEEKGVRLAHTVCYLSFGSRFDNNAFLAADIGNGDIKRAAEKWDKELIKSGWSANTIIDEEITKIGIENKLKQLKTSISIVQETIDYSPPLVNPDKNAIAHFLWYILSLVQSDIITKNYFNQNKAKFWNFWNAWTKFRDDNSNIKRDTNHKENVESIVSTLKILIEDEGLGFDLGIKNQVVSANKRIKAIREHERNNVGKLLTDPLTGEVLTKDNIEVHHIKAASASSSTELAVISKTSNGALIGGLMPQTVERISEFNNSEEEFQ